MECEWLFDLDGFEDVAEQWDDLYERDELADLDDIQPDLSMGGLPAMQEDSGDGHTVRATR